MDEPRCHIGGGSRGGAPRHTPPLTVGGSQGPVQPRPLSCRKNMAAGPTVPRHLRQRVAFQEDARSTPIDAVRVAGLLAGPCPIAVPCPQTHRRGGEEEVLIGLRVFCLR